MTHRRRRRRGRCAQRSGSGRPRTSGDEIVKTSKLTRFDPIYLFHLQCVVPAGGYELVRVGGVVGDGEDAVRVPVQLVRAQALLE